MKDEARYLERKFSLICVYCITNLPVLYTSHKPSECWNTLCEHLKTACNNLLAGIANWMLCRLLGVRKPKQTNKIQTFLLMNNPKCQTLLVHYSQFPTFLTLFYWSIFHLLFLYFKFSQLTAFIFNFMNF